MDLGVINTELEDLTDKKCSWFYAGVKENGRIHLDGYVSFEHLSEIMEILNKHLVK